MEARHAESKYRSTEDALVVAQDLLRQIIEHGKLELRFVVRQLDPSAEQPGEPAYVLDFSGPDQDLLLERNGALLDALESVVLKAARLDDEHFGAIALDSDDFRRARAEELKLMARVAADRVLDYGEPFALNPMTARERRIVHLALKDEPRVRSESEGFGAERRVVISPAGSK